MLIYFPRRYATPKWQAKIIPLDKQFHFLDGTVVSSIWELKLALTTVNDDCLSHHVSGQQNDLANWVEFVIGDYDLANALKKYTHRWGLIVALERQMMRTLNLPDYIASRWLSDAASPLVLSSGKSVSNLMGLRDVLEHESDDTVAFHLTREPNDFAQWILLSIGDYELAETVTEASNRLHLIHMISDHLDMLREASND
jgi:hypothetical protein